MFNDDYEEYGEIPLKDGYDPKKKYYKNYLIMGQFFFKIQEAAWWFVAELEDALAKSNDELSIAMKEMEEQKKKAQVEKRKAALAEAGLDEEEIEDSLASFDALADEAFESVVALMKKKAKKDEKDEEAEAALPPALKEAIEKKKKEKEEKDAKAEEEAEAEIYQEDFEEVQTSEAALVETEVEDEMETTRASVANWFENHVLNK